MCTYWMRIEKPDASARTWPFQACQQLASLCDNEAGTRTDPAGAGVSILPTCKEWSGAYDVSGLYSLIDHYRSIMIYQFWSPAIGFVYEHPSGTLLAWCLERETIVDWEKDIWELWRQGICKEFIPEEQALLATYSWWLKNVVYGSDFPLNQPTETLPLGSTTGCRIGLLYSDSLDHSEMIRNGTSRLKSTSAANRPNKPLIYGIFAVQYNMWLVFGG